MIRELQKMPQHYFFKTVQWEPVSEWWPLFKIDSETISQSFERLLPGQHLGKSRSLRVLTCWLPDLLMLNQWVYPMQEQNWQRMC